MIEIGTPAALEQARSILALSAFATLPSPHICPVTGGGVQLEWHYQGKELEIEIRPTGEIQFLAVENERSMEGSCSSVRDLFIWLLGTANEKLTLGAESGQQG